MNSAWQDSAIWLNEFDNDALALLTKEELEEFRFLTQPRTPLERLRCDPAELFNFAGMTPDPWQLDLLCSPLVDTLLLCSRQAGKSFTAAALALLTAILYPNSLILLLSRSSRQSQELFTIHVLRFYRSLARIAPEIKGKERSDELILANGSRIIALPGDEETIRCFSSVSLLVTSCIV